MTARAYFKLSRNGAPTGRARPLSFSLRKRVWSTGRKTWVVDLQAPARRHVFLELYPMWRDVQGCGGREELAVFWHLRNKT